MQKMLIVDDNEAICQILKRYAAAQGFECIIAKDGVTAFSLFNKFNYSVVLLDIMLPGMDGIELCKKIREISNVPIIMISAKTEEEDKILGLDIGADDYIAKPFAPKEVMARVRALLRRIGTEDTKIIRCKELEIDCVAHKITIAGIAVRFTKKEEALLTLLASYPGRVFTRENLFELAWNYDSDSSDRAVDTHIKRIRMKLEQVPHPGFEIKTIWGLGYTLEVKK